MVKAYADQLDKLELGITGHDYEVWRPPLAIASMIGGQVWEAVLSYAKESCEEKHQESYEELKQVLGAIYAIIKENGGKTPVAFRPKEIHDLIWERLKDEYRVTKEKQEVQGESSEKYDYDTHEFEKIYRVNRIGHTYCRQLGLKRRHTKKGTEYVINSPLEFHELVVRYYPKLPEQNEDYDKIVDTSEKPSPSSPLSLEQSLADEARSVGDDLEEGDDEVYTQKGNKFSKGDLENFGDNLADTQKGSSPEKSRSSGQSRPTWRGDDGDDLSRASLPTEEATEISDVGKERVENLGTADVVEKLRKEFSTGTADEFIGAVIRLGRSKDFAQALLNCLERDGKLVFHGDGDYVWR